MITLKPLILTLSVLLSGLTFLSIYSIQFVDLNGTQVNISQFQGKRILLVNIASESPRAGAQLPRLEQLYQQFKDSLVIIAFPTNDFGNEPRSDSALELLFQNTYHISFPVSKRINVLGPQTHPLYKWLKYKIENGTSDFNITKDFQKFLIGKNGLIEGYFASSVDPLDSEIINTINH